MSRAGMSNVLAALGALLSAGDRPSSRRTGFGTRHLAVRLSVVVALVLFFVLSAVSVPGWLLAVLCVALVPLVIDASRKRMRSEGAMVHSMWRAVTRR
jgi:hypothetical protein